MNEIYYPTQSDTLQNHDFSSQSISNRAEDMIYFPELRKNENVTSHQNVHGFVHDLQKPVVLSSNGDFKIRHTQSIGHRNSLEDMEETKQMPSNIKSMEQIITSSIGNIEVQKPLLAPLSTKDTNIQLATQPPTQNTNLQGQAKAIQPPAQNGRDPTRNVKASTRGKSTAVNNPKIPATQRKTTNGNKIILEPIAMKKPIGTKPQQQQQSKLQVQFKIKKVLGVKEVRPPQPKETAEKTTKPSLTCPICLDDDTGDPFKKLPNCKGAFHKSCLKGYVLQAIQDRRIPIKCPDVGCKRTLQLDFLQTILNKQEIALFNKQSLINLALANPNIYTFCPTPDCTHIFQLSTKKNAPFELQCPICKKFACLRCKVPVHTGLTCFEYQSYKPEDFELRDQLRGLKWKKCMKCRFWIEKNDGCNHMTCICGNQFCYICGKVWKTCNCKTNDEELVGIEGLEEEIDLVQQRRLLQFFENQQRQRAEQQQRERERAEQQQRESMRPRPGSADI